MLVLFCVTQVDPFAQHRQPTIAEREDEYRARRRQMVISPPRHDPFADGRCLALDTFFFSLFLLLMVLVLQSQQYVALFFCVVTCLIPEFRVTILT